MMAGFTTYNTVRSSRRCLYRIGRDGQQVSTVATLPSLSVLLLNPAGVTNSGRLTAGPRRMQHRFKGHNQPSTVVGPSGGSPSGFERTSAVTLAVERGRRMGLFAVMMENRWQQGRASRPVGCCRGRPVAVCRLL